MQVQQLELRAAADSSELRELRFYAEQVEADNKMLRELVDNQKNDIDCLLKLIRKVNNNQKRFRFLSFFSLRIFLRLRLSYVKLIRKNWAIRRQHNTQIGQCME